MQARANKILLLVSSLATLALLGWATVDENVLQEWRRHQRDYKKRLPADLASEFKVQLRQIVVPNLRVTDRCVSCHVGMAAGETGIDGHALFRKHPNVVHDPAEYGCTVCHGGQGRATARALRPTAPSCTGQSPCCRTPTPMPAAVSATRTLRCRSRRPSSKDVRSSSASIAWPATVSTAEAAHCRPFDMDGRRVDKVLVTTLPQKPLTVETREGK